jgi:hypothetical protein
MAETNPATDATRIAVEFLMWWMEPDRLDAAAHIQRVLNDPTGPDAAHIIAAQLNLEMFLVLMLAKERGADADNIMEKSFGILQALSRGLPE